MGIRFVPLSFYRNCSVLFLAVAVAGCGQVSDADIAAQQQAALAATVAAAPVATTPQEDTIVSLAATSVAMTAISVSRASPSPDVPPTSQPTTAPEAPSATIADTPMPSAIPATPTSVLAGTTAVVEAVAIAAPTTAAATTAPTVVPTSAPTAIPTIIPTVAPTSAPTTAPTVAPVANNSVTPLSFTDLYSGASIEGPILSEKAAALNGNTVVMVGYMAPPLKPDLDFFVLTKDPMVYCPFCSTATDWPFDIVFVRMAGGAAAPNAPTQGIRVIGRFATGTATDAATGFVSQVRIVAERVEVIQ